MNGMNGRQTISSMILYVIMFIAAFLFFSRYCSSFSTL